MSSFSLSSLLRPGSKINIVDIGASMLQNPPYQHLIDAGLAYVIGFEPNREECDKLNAKYGGAHKFFPYFIGDGKPATFHETNWFATGSLYKPNKAVLDKFQRLYEQVTPVAEHRVETKALDDLTEIDDVDYIKIDVQGAELSVFTHAERLLEKAVIIDTEVEFIELYEKQPLFADVDIFLRARGFSFVKFLYFGSRALKPLLMNNDYNVGSQMLWADALYLKYWINPENLSEDKLIKLAIIAHDIYKLYDFAHFLLRNLDARRGSTLAQVYFGMLTANQGPPP